MKKRTRLITLDVKNDAQMHDIGALLGQIFFAPFLFSNERTGRTVIASLHTPSSELLRSFVRGAQAATNDVRMKYLDLGRTTAPFAAIMTDVSTGRQRKLPLNNIDAPVGIRSLNGTSDRTLGYMIENPSLQFLTISTLNITAARMDEGNAYFGNLKTCLLEKLGERILLRRRFVKTLINVSGADKYKNDPYTRVRIGLVVDDPDMERQLFRVKDAIRKTPSLKDTLVERRERIPGKKTALKTQAPSLS